MKENLVKAILASFVLLQIFSMDRATAHEKGIKFPEEKTIITIIQRNVKSIPRTEGKVKISIGDITRGQVMASVYEIVDKGLATEQQITLLNQVSMRRGSKKIIKYHGRSYQLYLKELHNALVGVDKAIFVFEPVRKTKNQIKQDKIIKDNKT